MMMFANSPVIGLLLAVWSVFAVAQDSDIKRIPLRALSLWTPYLDSDMSSRWWDFGGSTVVRTDQYVRLTGGHPSQAGYIFSRAPLSATNWEIEVEFKITGTGHLYGDGMAMWITSERAEMGPVFGMKDGFTGLGIFFDTYKNNRPGVVFPYVMAMLGDGKTSYDQANDGKANELAGCSIRGARNSEHPTKAKVTYFKDKHLTVEVMYRKPDEWVQCFQIPNLQLPAVSYIGFSAETGELSDNHDIIRVDTNNLYSPTGSTNTNAAGSRDYSRAKNHKPSSSSKSGGGWLWFFTRIFLVLLVVAGGYIGYTAYRARRRDRF